MIRRLPALALCACLASTSLVGQQAPRFRVKGDAVQVDVSVVRGRRPVAGLTAANFELRDSGVVQQVKAVTLEDVPLHLVLVLDTSGSVRGAKLAELQEATVAAIGSLGPDDGATLLTFSQSVARHADASADRSGAAGAIAAAAAGGWTSVHDALLHALVLRHADVAVLPLSLRPPRSARRTARQLRHPSRREHRDVVEGRSHASRPDPPGRALVG